MVLLTSLVSWVFSMVFAVLDPTSIEHPIKHMHVASAVEFSSANYMLQGVHTLKSICIQLALLYLAIALPYCNQFQNFLHHWNALFMPRILVQSERHDHSPIKSSCSHVQRIGIPEATKNLQTCAFQITHTRDQAKIVQKLAISCKIITSSATKQLWRSLLMHW